MTYAPKPITGRTGPQPGYAVGQTFGPWRIASLHGPDARNPNQWAWVVNAKTGEQARIGVRGLEGLAKC